MPLIHNVEIAWDALINAFSSGESDRVYFLDRMTGEIFFVPSPLENTDIWQQMESNRDRFLEIPQFDYGLERRLNKEFMSRIEDMELKQILNGTLAGRKPYGNIDDILSFFPEEESRLRAAKDEFLTDRVKNWLEENNLFTVEASALQMISI